MVRRVLVLGFVIRVPLWAVNVAITLHVVTHLHRSYAEAGVVSMVAAGALALLWVIGIYAVVMGAIMVALAFRLKKFARP